MTEEHPITPPEELVQKWVSQMITPDEGNLALDFDWLANKAARWGADEELEACRFWVSENESIYDAAELVEYRRPKPKTLKEMKERGLKALGECYAYIPDDLYHEIKKVIESLPDES
jgi:hypothetical protein